EWGFAEQVAEAADSGPDEPVGQLSVGGFLRHRVGLWIERLNDRPLAKQRQSIDLSLRYKRPLLDGLESRIVADAHYEFDFAYLIKREEFDRATLDAYESQLIGGETFLGLSYGAFEVVFGRQIVAWGQGELLSPLDIVNPRDLREPGLADLDDIRLAVLATRAGLFFGSHRFEVMVVHESFTGLRPAPLSEFSPLRTLITSDPQAGTLLQGRQLRYRDVPGRFVDGGGQIYGRWSFAGAGIDLALYIASTLHKNGIAQLPGPEALAQREVAIDLWHPRYTMVGHAGAKPLGNWILRWELGLDVDRPLMVRDERVQALNIAILRREQANGMLGITYSGITDATLGLEYAQALVLDNPNRDDALASSSGASWTLLSPVEAPNFALRYSQTFMRETLSLSAALTAFGIEPFLGLVARAELEYELRDALKVSIGYITFQPAGGDDTFGPLYGMDRHDRLFTSLRWDFLL
ncbi:MAG: hypothetical protein OXR73_29695, partial [Myxococcales bacterium]|nr:hypothetical protein [Myxococcales bacterium]